MTVKQLIRKLQRPPCDRIAAVRIEFADGGVYEDSPDTHRTRSSEQRRRNLAVPVPKASVPHKAQ